MNWAKEFNAILNWDDPAISDFPDKKSEKNFAQVGKILSERLQNELGAEYEITYHFKCHLVDCF